MQNIIKEIQRFRLPFANINVSLHIGILCTRRGSVFHVRKAITHKKPGIKDYIPNMPFT